MNMREDRRDDVAMDVDQRRVLIAEAVGTMILMLGGPGSAVLAGNDIGVLGVSLSFGFALLIAAYVVGPVSGCHINPAVTLAMVVARKTTMRALPSYLIGQLVGAAVGGGLIFVIASGVPGFDAGSSAFATNGWGDQSPTGANFGAMLVVELVFTAVLAFVVLATTGRKFSVGQGGIVIGLTLGLIHLVTIPIDNTSVNPARSIGAVLWAGNGDAWMQLWAFIVFPLVGSVLGVLLWSAVGDQGVEGTMLDLRTVRETRVGMAGTAPTPTTTSASGPDAARPV